MNTAQTLLARLRSHGVEFVVAGDRVRFRPAALVSPEDQAALTQHKAEIIAELSVQQDRWQARAELRRELESLNALWGPMPVVRTLREIPATHIEVAIGWRVREVRYRIASGDRTCLFAPKRCDQRARLADEPCDRGHTFVPVLAS